LSSAGDRAAQELGVPLLPPSKAKNATFHRGANFGITGATSLDTPFFVERGLGQTVWNSGSLHTQIQWFQDMKPKLCTSPEECRELFRRSLFIVGEFGGNDYNSPLFAFRPISEAHDFVPHVVESIGKGVEKLIAEGAVDLVVPGVLPIGCFPVYLSIFRKQADGYGGRSGCIRDLNTLSWVHNAALRRKVEELRGRYPGVRIMYADYYTPAIQFVLHAEKYGESISMHAPFPSPSPLLIDVFSVCGHGSLRLRLSRVRFLTATWTGADTSGPRPVHVPFCLGKRFKTP
jgi:hypothetical protein